MKNDLSLRDKKSRKVFSKKELSNRFLIFFLLKLPMRPELVFFITFSLFGTQNWFIFCQEI